jgi:hypothetical protein
LPAYCDKLITGRIGTGRIASVRETAKGMKTEERRIIFMLDDKNVICEVPLEVYEPGDIKETKERLAQEMHCTPEEIQIKITGVKGGKANKGSSLHYQLFDINTIRNLNK